MRSKWFIIALILVVLPAAILSMLAARTIGYYELIMRAEVRQDAERVLSTVDSAIHDKSLHTLELVSITLASSLKPDAGADQLGYAARQFRREHATISEVLVFMNPWGFLLGSTPPPDADNATVARDLLANELRTRIADLRPPSIARRAKEKSPSSTRPAEGTPPLRGPPPATTLTFFYDHRAYYFTRMPGTASVWAGYAADRAALADLLDACLAQHAAKGMVLNYAGDSMHDPTTATEDVVVSDSLSSGGAPAVHARPRGIPGLPVLASTFLMPPLDPIEILAQAAPGVEIQQIATARTRLYGWGLILVIAWVLMGVVIVLRQTVVEIRQARQRGEFLLGVSHDLRTPLASMRMLAESLAMGTVRKKEQPRFMETIVSECDRLARLIERVLYLVRYGQGALVYCRTDVDLGQVINKTVADLKTYAGSLQVKIEPELPHIQGDRAALEQVALNLLDNAVKYGSKLEGEGETGGRGSEVGDRGDSGSAGKTTDAHGSTRMAPDDEPLPQAEVRGGRSRRPLSVVSHALQPSGHPPLTEAHSPRVEVTVDTVNRARHPWSRTRRWVRLTVRDFGMGIAPSEQRKIFHRFYRSARAHDRNVSGVGLGLALCRHVIRSHGGWITVESDIGKGTTFRAYLKCE